MQTAGLGEKKKKKVLLLEPDCSVSVLTLPVTSLLSSHLASQAPFIGCYFTGLASQFVNTENLIWIFGFKTQRKLWKVKVIEEKYQMPNVDGLGTF